MINIRSFFGIKLVTGTPHEMAEVQSLAGITLGDKDKLVRLPDRFHIQRNPRHKAILRYIEDKEAAWQRRPLKLQHKANRQRARRCRGYR